MADGAEDQGEEPSDDLVFVQLVLLGGPFDGHRAQVQWGTVRRSPPEWVDVQRHEPSGEVVVWTPGPIPPEFHWPPLGFRYVWSGLPGPEPIEMLWSGHGPGSKRP